MREVADEFRTVESQGFTINTFNPNGDEPCIVLGCGGKELVDLRNAIVEKISTLDLLQIPDNHEPWIPHVTLKYTEDPASEKVSEFYELTGPIVFDAIRVAFGGITDDVPLLPIGTEQEGYRYDQPVYVGGNRYGASVASGKSLDTKGRLDKVKAAQNCKYCGGPATKSILHGEGRGYIPVCARDLDKGKKDAGGRTSIDRVYDLPAMKSMWDNNTLADIAAGFALPESKGIRRVRTAAGVRRFGQPMGSVIIADGKLKNLKTVESDFEGYEKYTSRGKTYYTHKKGDKFEALDPDDNVVATSASEESLLRSLDSGKFTGSDVSGASSASLLERARIQSAGQGVRKKPASNGKQGFAHEMDSEYEGFRKFETSAGRILYMETRKKNGFYRLFDEDDNEILKKPTGEGLMAYMSDDPANVGGGKPRQAAPTEESTADQTQIPSAYRGALTAEESEYDGYQKFSAADGQTFYVAEDWSEILDPDDNVLGHSKVKNPKERQQLAFQAMNALIKIDEDNPAASTADPKGERAKKPAKGKPGYLDPANDDKPSKPSPQEITNREAARLRAETAKKREEFMKNRAANKKPVKPGDDELTKPKRHGYEGNRDVDTLRDSLDDPDEIPDLDAVLDKVKKHKGGDWSKIVEEIRRIAQRHANVRNKRKLNMFASAIQEGKSFEAMLGLYYTGERAELMAGKAVTPGGRVGDPSSRNLSPKENWVDKVGGLPRYIRFVRNMFLRKGLSMGHATAAAVNAIKRWAKGGDNVRPQVQAAAAAALAEWNAKKARA
jgi:hypothetical protein